MRTGTASLRLCVKLFESISPASVDNLPADLILVHDDPSHRNPIAPAGTTASLHY
jgi:hypothetical protein